MLRNGAGETLSDVQLYQLAREAGFSPDEAVLMTAIALAESGGTSSLRSATSTGYRVGLWQIPVASADGLTEERLLDPVENARLAYTLSDHGTDMSLWPSAEGGDSARYLDFHAQAVDAATSFGDSVSTATPSPMGAAVSETDPVTERPDLGDDDTMSRLEVFLNSALAQQGDEYIFGAVASVDDADPDAFDCAELVQWAAGRAGVEMTTGSWLQYLELKQQGATMTVEEALNTPGALLFHFGHEPVPGGGRPPGSHVAISLGDGENLIEARGRKYGVDTFSASGRNFNHAAYIPALGTAFDGDLDLDGLPSGPMPAVGTVDGAPAVPLEAPPEPEELFEYGADSDSDGLLDSVEAYLGTDPFHPDTDLDGFPDVEEVTDFATDPLDYSDNPIARSGAAVGAGGQGPELTSDRRARVEEQEEAVAEYEEALADAEAQADKQEERAYQEQQQLAAEQRADERAAAAVEEAEARAAVIRDEQNLVQDERNQRLVEAFRSGEAFRFSEDQIGVLTSEDIGLSDFQVSDLTLAVQEGSVEEWFDANNGLFDPESAFSGEGGYENFVSWSVTGVLPEDM
ncbi:MAG: hypothetical protein AAF467_08425 [Actinomycetota bacterium]